MPNFFAFLNFFMFFKRQMNVACPIFIFHVLSMVQFHTNQLPFWESRNPFQWSATKLELNWPMHCLLLLKTKKIQTLGRCESLYEHFGTHWQNAMPLCVLLDRCPVSGCFSSKLGSHVTWFSMLACCRAQRNFMRQRPWRAVRPLMWPCDEIHQQNKCSYSLRNFRTKGCTCVICLIHASGEKFLWFYFAIDLNVTPWTMVLWIYSEMISVLEEHIMRWLESWVYESAQYCTFCIRRLQRKLMSISIEVVFTRTEGMSTSLPLPYVTIDEQLKWMTLLNLSNLPKYTDQGGHCAHHDKRMWYVLGNFTRHPYINEELLLPPYMQVLYEPTSSTNDISLLWRKYRWLGAH